MLPERDRGREPAHQRSSPDARRRAASPTPRLSLPARVAIGALAVLGAVVAVQWILATVVAVVKFVLVVVIVVAVGAWILQLKSRR